MSPSKKILILPWSKEKSSLQLACSFLPLARYLGVDELRTLRHFPGAGSPPCPPPSSTLPPPCPSPPCSVPGPGQPRGAVLGYLGSPNLLLAEFLQRRDQHLAGVLDLGVKTGTAHLCCSTAFAMETLPQPPDTPGFTLLSLQTCEPPQHQHRPLSNSNTPFPMTSKRFPAKPTLSFLCPPLQLHPGRGKEHWGWQAVSPGSPGCHHPLLPGHTGPYHAHPLVFQVPQHRGKLLQRLGWKGHSHHLTFSF